MFPFGDSTFWNRQGNYLAENAMFSVYYNKIYKQQYLPSRIRYSQFFFFISFAVCCKLYVANRSQNNQADYSQRRYYTSERPIVNFIQRIINAQSAAGQASKQNLIF